MRYFLLQLLFIFLIPVFSGAQGLIHPELPPIDSALRADSLVTPEASLMNVPAINDPALFLPEVTPFQLPDFDFYRNLLNMRQDYSFAVFNPSGNSDVLFRYSAMPFIHSATVLNQAAYRITDRLTIGGNSYSGNSIFSSPLPIRGLKSHDFRGASMFFQYKVSKNIKIETHINVTNRQY